MVLILYWRMYKKFIERVVGVDTTAGKIGIVATFGFIVFVFCFLLPIFICLRCALKRRKTFQSKTLDKEDKLKEDISDLETGSKDKKRRGRMDASLIRKRIVLRGGAFDSFKSSTGIFGMTGVVVSINRASRTYRIDLEDGRSINLSHFELTGSGPDYRECSTATSSKNTKAPRENVSDSDRKMGRSRWRDIESASPSASTISTAAASDDRFSTIGGSEEVKNEDISSESSVLAASGARRRPPKRPSSLHAGDLVFVRDGRDPWRPGVVECIDAETKKPKVCIFQFNARNELTFLSLII